MASVSWQRYPSEDLVLGEWPAPVKRLAERTAPDHPSLYDVTPILPDFDDLLAARDAAEYARPSQERFGLVIDSRDRDSIERHARVMGWDDES